MIHFWLRKRHRHFLRVTAVFTAFALIFSITAPPIATASKLERFHLRGTPLTIDSGKTEKKVTEYVNALAPKESVPSLLKRYQAALENLPSPSGISETKSGLALPIKVNVAFLWSRCRALLNLDALPILFQSAWKQIEQTLVQFKNELTQLAENSTRLLKWLLAPFLPAHPIFESATAAQKKDKGITGGAMVWLWRVILKLSQSLHSLWSWIPLLTEENFSFRRTSITTAWWLENILLYYLVKPFVPALLHVIGLDFVPVNVALWGIFFSAHAIEFIVLKLLKSPRAPPLANLPASAIIAIFNVIFNQEAIQYLSILSHFIMNFSVFIADAMRDDSDASIEQPQFTIDHRISSLIAFGWFLSMPFFLFLNGAVSTLQAMAFWGMVYGVILITISILGRCLVAVSEKLKEKDRQATIQKKADDAFQEGDIGEATLSPYSGIRIALWKQIIWKPLRILARNAFFISSGSSFLGMGFSVIAYYHIFVYVTDSWLISLLGGAAGFLIAVIIFHSITQYRGGYIYANFFWNLLEAVDKRFSARSVFIIVDDKTAFDFVSRRFIKRSSIPENAKILNSVKSNEENEAQKESAQPTLPKVSVGDMVKIDGEEGLILKIHGDMELLEVMTLSQSLLTSRKEIKKINLKEKLVRIEVMTPRDIPGFAYNVGEKVQVYYDWKWVDGTIVSMNANQYHIITYEKIHERLDGDLGHGVGIAIKAADLLIRRNLLKDEQGQGMSEVALIFGVFATAAIIFHKPLLKVFGVFQHVHPLLFTAILGLGIVGTVMISRFRAKNRKSLNDSYVIEGLKVHQIFTKEGKIKRYSITDPAGRTIVEGNNLQKIVSETADNKKIVIFYLYTQDNMVLRVHYDRRGSNEQANMEGAVVRMVLSNGSNPSDIKAGLDRLEAIRTQFDGHTTTYEVKDTAGREIRLNPFGIEHIRIYDNSNGHDLKEVQIFKRTGNVNQIERVLDPNGKILKEFKYYSNGNISGLYGIPFLGGFHDENINKALSEILRIHSGNKKLGKATFLNVVGEEGSGKSSFAEKLRSDLEFKIGRGKNSSKVIVLSADRFLFDRYGGKRQTDIYFDKTELLGKQGFYETIHSLNRGETVLIPLLDPQTRKHVIVEEPVLQDPTLAARLCAELTEKFKRVFTPDNLRVDHETKELLEIIQPKNKIIIVEGFLSQQDPTLIPLYSKIIYVETDLHNRLLNGVYRHQFQGRRPELSDDDVIDEILRRSMEEGDPYTKPYLANAHWLVHNYPGHGDRFNRFLFDLSNNASNTRLLTSAVHVLELKQLPEEPALALVSIARRAQDEELRRLALKILGERVYPMTEDELSEYFSDFWIMGKWTSISPADDEGSGRTFQLGLIGDLQRQNLKVEYGPDHREIRRVSFDTIRTYEDVPEAVIFDYEQWKKLAPDFAEIEKPVLGVRLLSGENRIDVQVIVKDIAIEGIKRMNHGALSGECSLGSWEFVPLSEIIEVAQKEGLLFYRARQIMVLDPLVDSLHKQEESAEIPSGNSTHDLEETPLAEIISALELDKAQAIGGPYVDEFSKIRTYRVKIPGRWFPWRAPRGLQFLRNELGPTRIFDLLYDPDGTLNAIVPILQDSSPDFRWLRSPMYLDLTAYGFKIPSPNDPQLEEKWKAIGEKRLLRQKRTRRIIERYPIQMEALNQGASFNFAVFIPEIGIPYLLRFEPEDWLSPISRTEITGILKKFPNAQSVFMPVFPTVYSAARKLGDVHHFLTDYLYMKTVVYTAVLLRGKKDAKILVVGPGTGIDSWLAHLLSEGASIYSVGINPLEIANLRALAKIAGFAVNARVHDNILNWIGRAIFGSIKFDRVYSNPPLFTKDAILHLFKILEMQSKTYSLRKRLPGLLIGVVLLAYVKAPPFFKGAIMPLAEFLYWYMTWHRPLQAYWNGDRGDFIRGLAKGMSKVLTKDGKGFLWYRDSRSLNLHKIFKSVGLKLHFLDEDDEDVVIYEIEHLSAKFYNKRIPDKGLMSGKVIESLERDERGQGMSESALMLGALAVGMIAILNMDLHSLLILTNLFLGTLQLLIPIPLPNFNLANSLSRVAVHLVENKSEQPKKIDQSLKETMALVKKQTETTIKPERSVIYKVAYRITKIIIAINSFKKQNKAIVMHLDKFVQVHGNNLHVPNIVHPVLQGIAAALEETQGNQNVKIIFVFDSEKVEDVVDTLLWQLQIRPELLLFSSQTPDEAKKEIERRKLAVPYVLTLVSEDWKGFHRIVLNNLIEGLLKGFEKGIRPLQNLWEIEVYEIQA